jgi:hypothetical protein
LQSPKPPWSTPPPPPRQKVDRKLTFLTWLTWRPLSPEIIVIMGIITLLDESNSLNLIGWGREGGGQVVKGCCCRLCCGVVGRQLGELMLRGQIKRYSNEIFFSFV